MALVAKAISADYGVTVDVERDSAGGCFIRYRRPDPRPAKLKLVAEA